MNAKLFFALPVDQIAQQQIAKMCASVKNKKHARWVPSENYHVTLAFLGDTDRDNVDSIIEYASSRIETGLLPFQWNVNHLSYFRSGVLYLTGYNTPMEMTRLARDLEFLIPLHHKPLNFIPHVTLAREAHDIDIKVTEMTLSFNQVGLFESVTTPEGVVYKAIQLWQ